AIYHDRDDVFILNSKAFRCRLVHMNMPLSNDDAFFQVNTALRPNDSNARGTFKGTRIPYRSLHSESKRVCPGNLHLRLAAKRPQNAYVADGPLGPFQC